jgi:hypothetical protein
MHEAITSAGELLTTVLLKQNPVKYSFFYNADPASQKMLIDAKVTEMDPEDGDFEPDVWLIEMAVRQLEEADLVTTQELDDTLLDDEPDFLITLTEKGRAFLKAGKKFKFQNEEP